MDNILAIVAAVIALVLGGYGLYQVAFAQGYVQGHEDATDTEFTFTSEDDDE